jgi:hypothetical protein
MTSFLVTAHVLLSLMTPASMADEAPVPSEENVLVLQPAEVEPAMEAIDTSHIVLMGRGIEDRRDGRSLGLACIGDQIEGTEQRKCDYLRWILFSGPSQAEYIGGTLHLGGLNALKDDGTPSRAYVKSIKKYLRTLSKNSKKHFLKTHPLITAGGLIPVMGGLWLVGIATIPPFVVITVGGLLVMPLGNLVGSILFAPGMTFSSHNTVKATERDGWSWSSRPKKVSSNYFDNVLSQIR